MDHMHEFIKDLRTIEKALVWGKTKEEHTEYHKCMGKLNEQFKEEIFDELGIKDNPKRELLFSKAWQNGHSGGWEEVWGHAQDLVDLIK